MDNTKLSKFLSKILRHKPELIGLNIEKYGAWADIDELIRKVNENSKFTLSRELLEEIVKEDEKQRYKISGDGKKIRASQGHSIEVIMDMEVLQPPEILFHGTAERNINSILEKGIIHGRRLYVHLSKDTETALKVGARHGKPVIFNVRAGDMYKDGYVDVRKLWSACIYFNGEGRKKCGRLCGEDIERQGFEKCLHTLRYGK